MYIFIASFFPRKKHVLFFNTSFLDAASMPQAFLFPRTKTRFDLFVFNTSVFPFCLLRLFVFVCFWSNLGLEMLIRGRGSGCPEFQPVMSILHPYVYKELQHLLHQHYS